MAPSVKMFVPYPQAAATKISSTFLVQTPGPGIEITDFDGVWILGATPVEQGFQPYFLPINTDQFVGIDGEYVQLAVDPNGAPWVVDAHGQIFKNSGSWFKPGGSWGQLPGLATRISISPDGIAYILGTKQEPFFLFGDTWLGLPGNFVELAAGSNSLWAIDSSGQIFTGGTTGDWNSFPGTAKKIAIFKPDVPYIIGNDNQIYVLDDDRISWDLLSFVDDRHNPISMKFIELSSNNNGNMYAIAEDGSVGQVVDELLVR